MLQQGKNIGINKMEQTVTLPGMLVIFPNEIWKSNHLSHWPPYSSDLSPLDQCTQYVKKQKPKNICDLRRRVNEFAENIDEEPLRKMVRHNRERAALCVDSLGGHFVLLL